MYPIYFKDNICVKCGKNNINKIDAYNNIVLDNSDRDIRKVICSNCKTEYLLKWDNEKENYPIDKNNIENFKKKFNI